MTLYKFIQLNETEQADAVWEGVLIGDREDPKHKILLYQIDSFYVEVFYCKDENRIVRFRPFATLDLLEPYLKNLKINFCNGAKGNS